MQTGWHRRHFGCSVSPPVYTKIPSDRRHGTPGSMWHPFSSYNVEQLGFKTKIIIRFASHYLIVLNTSLDDWFESVLVSRMRPYITMLHIHMKRKNLWRKKCAWRALFRKCWPTLRLAAQRKWCRLESRQSARCIERQGALIQAINRMQPAMMMTPDVYHY